MNYKDVIQKMTMEEKASLLAGSSFWSTRKIDRLGIPAMGLADGPHGLRKQAEKGDHLGLVKGVAATCFPTCATLANSWDVSLCETVGQCIAKEAVANDVNVVLGPGLNIKRNPLCGRNFEYFSEDPYLTGKLAAAYIKGAQKEGISACPKHFAANNQESLRLTNDSIVDERTLRELYLTGFEIAVKEGGAKAIMSSYNKINGVYANENEKLLRDILVDEWGFSGIVVSDWGGSNSYVEAVRNGSHLEMPATAGDSAAQLTQAIRDGLIDESVVDQRISEFLSVLFEIQIKEAKSVNYEEQHSTALAVAEGSIVLLKNDGILPLKAKSRVAVFGDFAKLPRYQGAGSSLVNPYKLDNTLDLIKDYDLEYVGFAQGYQRIEKTEKSLLKSAVELAEKADVLLVYVGLTEVDEVEGCDRSDMKLSDSQIALLEELSKLSKPIVAVVSGGSPIEMQWEADCNAVVHGYLAGQAGAQAILNVITGKVNPSGKLSESYPMKYEDAATCNYYPGRERTSEYREALYVGYRYYDINQVALRYPFGFGLSYTSFSYSDFEVTPQQATFTITNIGSCDGSEIAQLYVGKRSETIYRPERELKGFTKVALKTGESKRISIDFDDKTFRYFDVETNQFLIEKGEYSISIGGSSRDIRLTQALFVEGVIPSEKEKVPPRYFLGDVKDVSDEEFAGLLGRELPSSTWDRTKPLELNDSLAQMVYAKSWLGRAAISILTSLREKSIKKGKPDLNLLFMSTLPFRAIGKMTGGQVTMEMVDGLLLAVNGHFFKGINAFMKAYFKSIRRRKNDRYAKAI